MTAPESGDTFTMGQVHHELLRCLTMCDEAYRWTEPGAPAPPPATHPTESPPPVVRRTQRARHEALPLHSQVPSVADRPVILQPMPPRPAGLFYAPGYPLPPSQPYYWPPHGYASSSGAGPSRAGPSQYPPRSSVQSTHMHPPPPFQTPFPSQMYYTFPAYSSSGPSQGLDSFSEGYHPQFADPVAATPTAFSVGFFQTPQDAPPPSGMFTQDDPAGAMQSSDDDGEDEDDQSGDDDGGDGEHIRRNPVRGARERCQLSGYEHDISRCAGYHETRRQRRR